MYAILAVRRPVTWASNYVGILGVMRKYEK